LKQQHIDTSYALRQALSNQNALIDSGENVHIASEQFTKSVNTTISYFTQPIIINTAGKGEIIKAIGKIDTGGYIGLMLVVPTAEKILLSVTILQLNGLNVLFGRNNQCTFTDLNGNCISVRKERNGLYYISINAFTGSKLNKDWTLRDKVILQSHNLCYYDTIWSNSLFANKAAVSKPFVQ
jgi:hypothetical protein